MAPKSEVGAAKVLASLFVRFGASLTVHIDTVRSHPQKTQPKNGHITPKAPATRRSDVIRVVATGREPLAIIMQVNHSFYAVVFVNERDMATNCNVPVIVRRRR